MSRSDWNGNTDRVIFTILKEDFVGTILLFASPSTSQPNSEIISADFIFGSAKVFEFLNDSSVTRTFFWMLDMLEISGTNLWRASLRTTNTTLYLISAITTIQVWEKGKLKIRVKTSDRVSSARPPRLDGDLGRRLGLNGASALTVYFLDRERRISQQNK